MELELRKQAAKYLNKQTAKTRKRLDNALDCLTNLEGDIKKIDDNFYRLKIHHYRIIFSIEGDIIKVKEIAPRTDIKY